MKIAKIVAGVISALGFLYMLGSVGNIDYAMECGSTAPVDIMGQFVQAFAGLLVFAAALIFMGLADYYENWRHEADISAGRCQERR